MKKIIFTLILTILSVVGYSQVPTPNPANGDFYCPNDVQVYGDQVIDPNATYSFSITPAFPFNVISGGDQIEVTWTTPGVYTIEFDKGVVQIETNVNNLLVYFPCNCNAESEQISFKAGLKVVAGDFFGADCSFTKEELTNLVN